MARLEYFVVSRAVSIDQSTNATSIFEILEEVQTESFPAIIPTLVATSLWRQEPGDEETDFQQVLKITLPSGKESEFPVNFTITSRRHRITQRVGGVPVETEGELLFEVILNGEHAAQHVVDILQQDPIDLIEQSAAPAANDVQ